ncbi:MAG: penicillin acylase family protein [Hyphomonadaceae bacterium]|nr:penicillin acylase family protein [Hyphomonadaceae bacterium]
MRWSVAAAVLIAMSGSAVAGERPVAAEVRYSEYGVAHIEAESFEGAGRGYGLALARDNLCAVVERAVTLAGERSAALPARETYFDAFAGGPVSNVDSDAVYRYLFPQRLVQRVRNEASRDMRDLVAGFVVGFNEHVAAEGAPGESCRQQRWFRPLTEADIWRRIAHVPLLETTAGVLREIIAASPPGAERAQAAPDDTLTRLAALETVRGASNAAAFGRDGIEGGGGGMSFSNPHYAWHGTERLHAFHLHVRGRLNVFGATAYGLPFPLMGFSDAVGWSITHTTDKRSTVYEFTLDPNDSTRYMFGERSERMRAVRVEVPTQDGPVTRTFWETRYGPVIEGEGLPWDRTHAYAFADPERANFRFADQFLSIARARNVHEIHEALNLHAGSPWSNVTAADRDGNVFYSNTSVAANITDAQLSQCVISGPARRYMDLADVTTLNGSDPACAWTTDRRARQRGIIPAVARPAMERSDVTFNSNDSHWFATLGGDGRLEGFQQVIGPERTTRGERTRIAALYSRDIIDGSPLTGAPGATPAKWERLFFSARNLTAELVLDDLIADCRQNPSVTVEGAAFNLTQACAALAAWDRRDTLQSRGSALFAEFLRKLEAVPMTGFALVPRYWRVPFDPADPVGTPRGFVTTDETRQALARAAHALTSGGIALDAPLGEVQSVTRNGRRLPVSGSMFTYHMVRPSGFTPGQGITEIRSGDSYIHVVSLRPDGVRGRFLVTYSQSTNPMSPHFADMTVLFSEQRFADIVFSEDDIRAHQVGDTIVLH